MSTIEVVVKIPELKGPSPPQPNQALKVLLQTTLQHMADFQIMMLSIVSEKYGHSIEELIQVVQEDPRFTSMTVDPLLHSLAKEQEVPLKTKKGKKVVLV
jgi:hypothetical protein